MTQCRSLQQMPYEYQQQLSGIPLISEHVLVVKASNHLVMPNMDDAGRGVPRACQRYFVYSGDRVRPAASTSCQATICLVFTMDYAKLVFEVL